MTRIDGLIKRIMIRRIELDILNRLGQNVDENLVDFLEKGFSTRDQRNPEVLSGRWRPNFQG